MVVCFSPDGKQQRNAQVDLARELDVQAKAGEVTASVKQSVVVREGKSTESAKLGKLEAGDVVRVLSCSAGSKSKSASASGPGKFEKSRVEIQLPNDFVRGYDGGGGLMATQSAATSEQLVGWCNLYAKDKSQVLELIAGGHALAARQQKLDQTKQSEEEWGDVRTGMAVVAIGGMKAGGTIKAVDGALDAVDVLDALDALVS